MKFLYCCEYVKFFLWCLIVSEIFHECHTEIFWQRINAWAWFNRIKLLINPAWSIGELVWVLKAYSQGATTTATKLFLVWTLSLTTMQPILRYPLNVIVAAAPCEHPHRDEFILLPSLIAVAVIVIPCKHALVPFIKTRMYSSGMHTGRLLTISQHSLGEGVSARGVSVQGVRVADPPCGQTDTCENITFPNFVCGR